MTSNAPRFGALVETRIRDRYRLQTPTDGRDAWRDAVTTDGTAVEIKGAQPTVSDGVPGRFRLFRKQHRRLERAGGMYALAVYQPRGSGISLVETALREPGDIGALVSGRWSPSDHETRQSGDRGMQVLLPIREVF